MLRLVSGWDYGVTLRDMFLHQHVVISLCRSESGCSGKTSFSSMVTRCGALLAKQPSLYTLT